MTTKGRQSPTSFAWQAAAILLPVLILSALGLAGVIGDRREVELKARDEALVLCERLSFELEQRLVTLFTDHAAATEAAWGDLQQRAAGARDRPGIDSLELWHRKYPQDPIEQILTLRVVRTPSGALLEPRPSPGIPSPPSWLGSLGLSAREALAEAHQAERVTADVEVQRQRWQAFAQVAPAEALPVAAFAAARLRGQSASDEWLPLLESSGISEAGIPVSTLAGLELLAFERAGRALDPKSLAGLVQVILKSPSLLSARMVEIVEQQSFLSNALSRQQSSAALRRIWELSEQARGLASLTSTELGATWVTSSGRSYLARTIRNSDGNFATWFLPKSAVERLAENIVRDLRPGVASYSRVDVRLVGQRILGREVSSGEVAQALLASTQRKTTTADMGLQIEVGAHLVDYDGLYATQRRRTLRMGAIVLAATAAALAGLFAAWRAFQRQRRLAEEQSNFVASVSHELRAPIAAVSLMTENLAGPNPPSTERRAEYFQLILQECRRLGSLIENVLDFSRIDRGVKRYEREPTQLSRLVEATVELLRHATTHRNVELVFRNSARADLQATVDGRAIQQALINLIDNAVKHTPPGGPPVLVELSASTKVILLSVTDQGPGIPAIEKTRIFDRFHRLGSELRRETEGIGIGLSLVKHIAEAHGGVIRLESEPGQGSRFTLILPLQADDSIEGGTRREL